MGMIENKMETTIVYWGNMGIMEFSRSFKNSCYSFDGVRRADMGLLGEGYAPRDGGMRCGMLVK